MTREMEYDFLAWTSFPSSLKLSTDEPVERRIHKEFDIVQVQLGRDITVKVFVKGENLNPLPPPALTCIAIVGWDGTAWRDLMWRIPFPLGSYNWTELSTKFTIPANISAVKSLVTVMSGNGSIVTIWLDDLKIYQSGVLIYSDDFSNWNPTIGAGVGAPIGGVAGYLLKEPLGPIVSEVVGAVVGGTLGGGIGLLTGRGIIPAPQIPSLGAAPEGPGAPARLGKYLITG